ncbi:MAG: TetR/AcrR family transcriptional regulator [Xanthobacteraceae bacterium]|nr:TetR/AcrR family transcriptional regulator [Hyphomicrobiales bacterium]
MAQRVSRKTNPASASRRMTRAEKLEETRRTIIASTAQLVGKYGYAATTTARIARAANVAQGTIFNYFETRQELFDILLPTYAEEMLSFIRSTIDPDSRGLDREVERLRAFLDFVRLNPWVVRLVNESQALAPKAFTAYLTLVTEGYIRALQRSVDRGEIGGYEAHELEAVAIALLAVRSYYAEKYVIQAMSKQTPPWVYQAYRKFVERALFPQR